MSFRLLKPTSSIAPTEPRNPPEPKKKGVQLPQAKDLEKLHQRYGELAEAALKSAQDGGVRKRYKERICRPEEDNEDDIRQWHRPSRL